MHLDGVHLWGARSLYTARDWRVLRQRSVVFDQGTWRLLVAWSGTLSSSIVGGKLQRPTETNMIWLDFEASGRTLDEFYPAMRKFNLIVMEHPFMNWLSCLSQPDY